MTGAEGARLVKHLADLIGREVLVPWPNCPEECLFLARVVAFDKRYGRWQILVKPRGGIGSMWVRSWREVPAGAGTM